MRRTLLILVVAGAVFVGGYFVMQKKVTVPEAATSATSDEVPAKGTDLRGTNGEIGFEIEPATYKKPPQEAIDACKGHATHSVCSVEAPNGTLAGTCLTSPDSSLACVPN